MIFSSGKFRNLTPHEVIIHQEDGKAKKIAPESTPVRLEEKVIPIEKFNGIIIYKKEFGSGNLPEPQPGVKLIVSLPVAQSFPERRDIVVPNDLVRDPSGRIIGCKSLALVS